MLTGGKKVEYLRGLAREFPRCRVFVETGLWERRGSGQGLVDCFDELYAIDIQPANCEPPPEGYDAVLCGDSATVLPGFLAMLERPAMFWLDAHHLEEYDGADECPLLAELAAIVDWPHAARSVVVIDDVRLFDRATGYPSMAQVEATVTGIGYFRESQADDIVCFHTGR